MEEESWAGNHILRRNSYRTNGYNKDLHTGWVRARRSGGETASRGYVRCGTVAMKGKARSSAKSAWIEGSSQRNVK